MRLLDYLCTNYSKSHHIVYLLNNRVFNLFVEYKTQLRMY